MLWCFSFFFEHRGRIHQDFPSIFSSDIEDAEDLEETEPDENEKVVDERIDKSWAWYGFLYKLAKGDILKIETITKLNFMFVITHLSYEIANKK